MNGDISEIIYFDSNICRTQSELWISTAVKKANIAVSYDKRGQFRNAILYYTEAAKLLEKAIINSKDLKSEIEELKTICDIYLKRVECLFNVIQNQQAIVYASHESKQPHSSRSDTNGSSLKKYPASKEYNITEFIPEVIQNTAAVESKESLVKYHTNSHTSSHTNSHTNSKNDSVSSTFSNFFSKRNLKINTKPKDDQGDSSHNNGLLSPLKQFSKHALLGSGKSNKKC